MKLRSALKVPLEALSAYEWAGMGVWARTLLAENVRLPLSSESQAPFDNSGVTANHHERRAIIHDAQTGFPTNRVAQIVDPMHCVGLQAE